MYKNATYLILFLLVLFIIYLYLPKKQDINQLEWLVGQWQRIDLPQGQSAIEKWKLNESAFQGIGISFKGNDTTFVEHLKIVKIDHDLFYVAEVSHNDAPVFFKIELKAEDGFVCSNPKHDFPKKIDYQLNDSLLKVVISGDGREVSFSFKKVKKQEW